MPTRLTPETLARLRDLEAKLRIAVSQGKPDAARKWAGMIQKLFPRDRKHHRLLRAKLWAFEACLDANQLRYAESGFAGVRKLAGHNTRLYLEATAFLGICLLRSKQIEKAKQLMREVIQRTNNIRSDRKRRQFHRRFITRIEEECLLAELIGEEDVDLDPEAIHVQAVQLLQEKSEQEIAQLMGDSVPPSGTFLLREVREYSVLQLPAPERKFLPPPETAEKPASLGKRALAVLHRIGWRTLCDSESPIYKAWSQKLPEVYSGAFFAFALTETFKRWRIGLPLLVAGVVAIAMKYSAHEFCERTKPQGLMIPVGDKESSE